MRDPYQVLGVGRNATEEEIKKAYKSLSRRYHPDANINNPRKEQAEETFKEIQSAYQQVMKERTEGYGSYDGGSYGSGSGTGRGSRERDPFGGFGGFGGFYGGFGQSENAGYEEDTYLRAAGNYLRSGYYKEARTALDGMGQQGRNARWYYYSAIAHSGLGNNVAGLEHARRAAAMEPSSREYENLVHRFENGSSWYEQRQAAYGYPAMGNGNMCLKLCIANIICNVFLGGGGMCCGRGMYY
ncbi:MAG: DnaJ domain-containing protein [Clostridium sp.]|jgi:molecular chaperone DnaJ|nr:DnaJ domain-containing protein [Clostridium sp.]